jgi:molybdate transport system substrate-binding protein
MIVARLLALATLVALAPRDLQAQGRGEIKVWTARAIATVLADVGPVFERTSSYHLNVTSDLPDAFARRLDAGESFDVIITGSAVVDQWIGTGRIAPRTRSDIARSGIGVEVRKGAPTPDISSVQSFRRALLDAKSIAYLRVGSGIHVAAVVDRLGLADSIKAKVTRPEADIVSELVAKGQIELGIVVMTQILTTPGVELVGPLPPELQAFVTFSAGVNRRSTIPEAAMQLIRFLRSPAAVAIIRQQGMEPLTR